MARRRRQGAQSPSGESAANAAPHSGQAAVVAFKGTWPFESGKGDGLGRLAWGSSFCAQRSPSERSSGELDREHEQEGQKGESNHEGGDEEEDEEEPTRTWDLGRLRWG